MIKLFRYLCIICYPGMVGCQDMVTGQSRKTPASQRKRRKVKDKIKVSNISSFFPIAIECHWQKIPESSSPNEC